MILEPTIFATIFLAVLTLIIPGRFLLVPYVIAACFVPTDQRIIIMGLDFTVLRVLVLIGVLRIFIRGEHIQISWHKFDQIIFAWLLCGAFVYVIQWMTLKAMINRAGFLFDALGLYWLFRQKIRSWADIKFAFSVLAFCIVLMAPLIALEFSTGRNPFVLMGRVITKQREERMRCQGAFPHSIMLGLFCATLVPAFLTLAMLNKKKILYWLGAIAAVFIVIASASSTPIMVVAVVLVGMAFFKWRRYTAKAAWFVLVVLIALHMLMQAPIWHLLARVNIVEGSTGYHRYKLIDQAIEHFDEWALIGSRSTEHWGWGTGDITNQYILEGVRGGFIALMFFVSMLYIAFKVSLESSLRTLTIQEQRISWCFFVMMLGHSVGFLGVSYFGQMTMLWFMMLIGIAFIFEAKLKARYVRRKIFSMNNSLDCLAVSKSPGY
ncbi:hypothetical protein ACFL3G_03425 [Planctomycetota bacterium]